MHTALRILPVLFFSASAVADEADVVGATADCDAGRCRISASVRHADSGWDHYADHWRVLAPDGSEIARRVLLHPHEQEQPFTRSLDGVVVPAGVDQVWIEAHDKVHGYGGRRFKLALPQNFL